MRKLILLCIFTLVSFAHLFSQRLTENFEITLPGEKVEHSLYRTIECIDSRYDTTFMGIIQLGAFNKKAKVIPEIPFSTQLQNVLNSLAGKDSKDGKLLFHLRQFNFAELTGTTSEKGYCYLRADLYSESDNSYLKISSIDTVIFIKGVDVTRALFRKASKMITNFIGYTLDRKVSGSDYYSFREVAKMDSIEKRKIKVYNTSEYTDGLYLTWQSFMNQVPDKQIIVEKKNNKVVSLNILNERGKKVVLHPTDAYAIVVEGVPFIATDYGFYLLQKINDDFKFIGRAHTNARAGDVIAASVFFGVMGGVMATEASATFEMKIDHINGGFIRLRERYGN
jgi:hypothetical protein